MKRRTFVKKAAIAGAAIAGAPLAGKMSLAQALSGSQTALPLVHLTQQDFVSTFPWGIRGDKVRILQQEAENELLDAETLAALAFMLGFRSSSEQLDEAWKLLLNSHNHDVHVCLRDEVGIEWCGQARIIAAEVRQKAGAYMAGAVGGAALALNTLSWTRPIGTGLSEVPAFGYAVHGDCPLSPHQTAAPDKGAPWTGWFKARDFSLRLREDGCLEAQIGAESKSHALLGYLTLFDKGKNYDSRSPKPSKIEAWLSPDGNSAHALLEGKINEIAFQQKVLATGEYIDAETTLDYGRGAYFGPEIEDFEKEPRRTHYFQHERKLCTNWQFTDARTKLLYNSPFLSWPADKTRSVESLHYAALQAGEFGIAHFNIGQSGYGYIENESLGRHVLAFAPTRYVYGKADKLVLQGRQTHRCRFMPYRGDWRKAKLPLAASEYQRPILFEKLGGRRSTMPGKAGLVQLDSNTTIATALFERKGRLFLRLWEWAGQQDSVSLRFGDANSSLVECTHALQQTGPLEASFKMRPWEIKTIELKGKATVHGDCPDFRGEEASSRVINSSSPRKWDCPLRPQRPVNGYGKAELSEESRHCSRVESLADLPQGWERKNLFSPAPPPKAPPAKTTPDAVTYFASGYHDGFVKPLEKHTPTMEIEMRRARSPKYANYASTWEIGGSCWVEIGKNEPEYLEALKPYLKEGSIEIVGGTWCEPLSLTISGEANIRQFMYGLEASEKHLGIKIGVYMNQEHGTFAQMPQILRSFGLKAVVNRTHWAPFGYQSGLDADVAQWVGVDGSKIFLIPRYNSMDYGTFPGDGKNQQNGGITGHYRAWRTEEKFKEVRDMAIARGVRRPLTTMLEDIWSPELRTSDQEMDFYASLPFVKFTSIARYLAMFGI